MTVRYNPARLNAGQLLDILRHHGYLLGSGGVVRTNTPSHGRASAPARTTRAAEATRAALTPAPAMLLQVAAPKVGQFLLSWTIERALTAALAGLL